MPWMADNNLIEDISEKPSIISAQPNVKVEMHMHYGNIKCGGVV